MKTTSIVTFHNEITDIEKIVTSAIQNNIDKIYIIDNSVTELFKGFESKFPKILYLHYPTNIGYGAGRRLLYLFANSG